MSSPEDAFAERIDIRGRDIGVVGISTAWLSKDEHDQGKLTKDPGTAIRLAQAVLDTDPGNAKLAVKLARIYRECGEPAQRAVVLASFAGQVGDDRSFWYEWATCAGNADDYCANAWRLCR